MTDGTPLMASQRVVEQGTLVEIVGAMDITNTSWLRDMVMAAAHNTPVPRLILDLRRVESVDSSGLALLVDTMRVLAAGARRLHLLVAPGSQPDRILKLGDFERYMTVAPALEEVV